MAQQQQQKTVVDPALVVTPTAGQKIQAAAALDQTHLQAGQAVIPHHLPNWDEIRTLASNAYGIGTSAEAKSRAQFLSNALLPLERAFEFKSQPSDTEYRYLQVEPLLDQSASLLDRCITDRAQRDLYAVEAFKNKLELEQFFQLEDIHDDEIKAGLYTLPYVRAKLDGSAEQQLSYWYDLAAKEIDRIISNGAQTFQNQVHGRELAAWLAAYPLKQDGLNGQDATYGWNGVVKTKPLHLQDASNLESVEEVNNFLLDTFSQFKTLRGTSDASDSRSSSYSEQAKWSFSDIDFRRRRTQVSRDGAEEKVRQTSMPGGALNYGEKINTLEDRINYDYRETIARLSAVNQGLALLYGYEDPFPDHKKFDSVVLWVRRALNWIIRFTRNEQNYILPLSLRQLKDRRLATDTNHKTAWKFAVSEDMFPNQRHVRLRGVGGAVRGTAIRGLWQATLRVPAQSSCHHLSGQTKVLDQRSVPPVYLGRIAERTPVRDPDVAGINALYNASPFGEWNLALHEKSTDGMEIDAADDIQIELHLAVRST